jgi:hypothetical protein
MTKKITMAMRNIQMVPAIKAISVMDNDRAREGCAIAMARSMRESGRTIKEKDQGF